VPYHVYELHPYHLSGMVTRTSTRWFRHWRSERRVRSVPYVTECGKFSAHELLTWYAYPEQVVASLTSTVYTRLLKIWLKRKRRFRDIKPKDRELLLKVAAVYVTSHSDYFMDRALACLHRPGPLSSLVTCFVRKLDDKFWFVYSQICYQINWLTFQSLGISDKSRKQKDSSLNTFMSNDSKVFRDDVIRSAFETASNDLHWIKFRKTPYVPVPKLRDRITDKSVLAFFEDWSEPELDVDW
jgi:hypothetical protein